jgi:hypothetical protein
VAQRVPTGRGVVAGANASGGLGAQVFLLGFELAHLAHEALDNPRGRRPWLKLPICAIFLLELQRGIALDARDKQDRKP